MEEKELKTSTTQRIIIGVIAILMVGSFIASYAAIIAGNSKNNSDSSGISSEKVAEYESNYEEKLATFKSVTADDFNKFVGYKSEVKAYNEASANANGVVARDLLVGSGRTLTADDKDYYAYYIGWCADETVFDTSLNDFTSPSYFTGALDASIGLIEGWYFGVDGMNLGGVREITIPGELAYGDSTEICGGTNKPLKFIVMTVAKEEPLLTAASNLETAYMKMQYAYYGIDYDAES